MTARSYWRTSHSRVRTKWSTKPSPRISRARELLGEEFVDHYVRTREWEVRQYERAVTSWELERYIELI